MKTPREILLQRHQSAQPKLDAIRKQVVATLSSPSKASRSFHQPFSLARLPLKLWQELVWSCRRVWIGFAAVWLVIVAVNVANNSGEPNRVMARATPPPSPQMLAALEEQRLLLSQLLGGASEPAMPSRRKEPPRSELWNEYLIG